MRSRESYAEAGRRGGKAGKGKAKTSPRQINRARCDICGALIRRGVDCRRCLKLNDEE